MSHINAVFVRLKMPGCNYSDLGQIHVTLLKMFHSLIIQIQNIKKFDQVETTRNILIKSVW